MIHAQTIREDQIMRAAHLGVEASFFVGHTFYWGDWHLERTLGPQRGQNISPLAWADLYGLGWTLHTDAPVTPVSVIDTLRYATHRVTRAGVRIGAHQQVSIGRALRAVTVDAARQWNLSDRGSLVVGKRADFVVLSSNPLTADDLQGLRVIKTVVDGRLVYSATPR
jgi:predicted amidohydrolase YtcJ